MQTTSPASEKQITKAWQELQDLTDQIIALQIKRSGVLERIQELHQAAQDAQDAQLDANGFAIKPRPPTKRQLAEANPYLWQGDV